MEDIEICTADVTFGVVDHDTGIDKLSIVGFLGPDHKFHLGATLITLRENITTFDNEAKLVSEV